MDNYCLDSWFTLKSDYIRIEILKGVSGKAYIDELKSDYIRIEMSKRRHISKLH